MEKRLMEPPVAASQEGFIPQFQHCIEACLQCFESCEQLIVHLNDQDGIDPYVRKLLSDVVEITQVSANFMLRGSNFHIRTCGVCAEVCKVCAEECEKKLSKDDEVVASAIAALKDCSESCYQMAHHH